MRITSRMSNEQGVALVTALLAMLLATGLMAGMFAALTADQRSHAVDRDQSQAYAAAHAGLEKLTSSLAQLFSDRLQPERRPDRTSSTTCRRRSAASLHVARRRHGLRLRR